MIFNCSFPRATLVDDNTWWVIGGYNYEQGRGWDYMKSSLVYRAGSGWSAGPAIPVSPAQICFVKISDDKFFIAGGLFKPREVCSVGRQVGTVSSIFFVFDFVIGTYIQLVRGGMDWNIYPSSELHKRCMRFDNSPGRQKRNCPCKRKIFQWGDGWRYSYL